MNNILTIRIIGTHPMESLTALNDLIVLLDRYIAYQKGPDGFLTDENLPVVIHTESKEDDERTKTELYQIKTVAINRPRIHDPARFATDDSVRLVDNGARYIVKAAMYMYSPYPQWNYFIVTDDDKSLIKPQSDLISSDDFHDLFDKLKEMTGREWAFNYGIGMFEQIKNKSRKMRITDVMHQWHMFINKEEVPF